MAGSYPDVPGYRFAYDLNGTVAVDNRVYNGTNVNWSNANLQLINNDAFDTYQYGLGTTGFLTFLFPEERNISGILLNHSGAFSVNPLSWSNNTTYGLDGSWTDVPGITASTFTDKANFRTDIQPVSITNVSAIRLTIAAFGSRSIRNVHIYGSIPSASSPNRLRVIDLDSSDIAAQLDFGNLKQRANTTRQFKVINNSATQTASSILVSLNAPTDASPSIIGQYQVATDNVSYANAVNIGTLAPEAESGILYVRMNPASNAQLGPWSARIIAHPTSWS